MDEAYFRAKYETDAANKAKQSLKEYEDWVRRFYEGQRFPPVSGWGGRERDILAKAPAAMRGEVEPVLRALGQRLAAEWAKDNAVRKVSTSDLQAWGKRMSDASKDGAALVATLRELEAELAKRGA